MSGAPTPIAQGDLTATPFAHVLFQLHQRQLSGTLAIWPEGDAKGQDRIVFDKGVPVGARFLDGAAALDRGLLQFFRRKTGPFAFYEADLVTDGVRGRADVYTVLAASTRGAMRDDAIDGVLAAFGDGPLRYKATVDRKRFQFLPKEEAFFDVVRASPATFRELVEMCELGPQAGRRLVYLLVLTQSLEPYAEPAKPRSSGAPPPRASTAPRPPSNKGMPKVTPKDVAPPKPEPKSQDSLPLPDFGDAAPAERQSVPSGRTSLTDALRTDDVRHLVRGPDLPPAPPPNLSNEGRAFWKEVADRVAALDRQNYFEMLEVPRDVGADAVRKQYFALAKRLHPDRVVGELLPLRSFVEVLFHHLTEAHETLHDEKRRQQYFRTVQDGGGTPEADRKIALVLHAAKEHQKAEFLLRRRDFEGAAALVRAALELAPDESDLLVTLGYCLFNLPGSEHKSAEILSYFERALAITPQHDKAHHYAGLVYVRLGKDNDALKHFTEAATINPKNLEAVREVRLAQMRRDGKGGGVKASGQSLRPDAAAPAKAEGGLLSKLFGGRKDK